MLKINAEIKKILEKTIGLPLDKVYELSPSEEYTLVKSRTGRILSFSKKQDDRRTGRGNPLLSRRKFTTLDEIDAKIDTIVK